MFRSPLLVPALILLPILSARPTEAFAVADTLTTSAALADSAAIAKVHGLLARAATATPWAAVPLLREADALADSARLPAQERLAISQALVDGLIAQGEMTKANREWPNVLRYTEDLLSQQAVDAGRVDKERFAAAAHARDSLAAQLAKARQVKAEEDAVPAGLLPQAAVLPIALIGSVALLALLALVLTGRRLVRMRHAMKELQQEVTWLRMVSRKHLENKPVAAPATDRDLAPAMASMDTVQRHAEARQRTLLDVQQRKEVPDGERQGE